MPWIDAAANASVGIANALHHRLFELRDRDLFAEFCHFRFLGRRINRPADQRQACGHRFGIGLIEVRRCRQSQRGRLANRHDMHIGPQCLNEFDKIIGVGFDIELTVTDRNVARIEPICHVNVIIRE